MALHDGSVHLVSVTDYCLYHTGGERGNMKVLLRYKRITAIVTLGLLLISLKLMVLGRGRWFPGDEGSDVRSDDVTTTSQTRVLLMTYMRGGSTLLGEIFDQNPDVFYWFEPFNAVYSYLYGAIFGWLPLDIWYNTDQISRHYPGYEEEAIWEYFNSMMSCDTRDLPYIVQGSIRARHFSSYPKCASSFLGNLSALWKCNKLLAETCPRYFSTDGSHGNQCYNCLHGGQPERLYHPDTSSACPQSPQQFSTHRLCFEWYTQAMSDCARVKERCSASSTVAMKSIRLKGDFVLKLMQHFPDLKVIHQMRDPRGILASRMEAKMFSVASRKKLIDEAVLLCDKIVEDMTYIGQMETIFPDRILRISYENLVLHPHETARKVYDFIGQPLPRTITQFLDDSLHAQVQGGTFQTTRKNGTSSVYKWRKKLGTKHIMSATKACSGVLRMFNYEL